MPRRRAIRLLLVVVCLLAVGVIVADGATGGVGRETVAPSAPPADGITVISADAAGGGYLVAYGPDGDQLYRTTTPEYVYDVDPVPGTAATVTYARATELSPAACGATTPCLRSSLVRLNLSTGSDRVLWSRVRPVRGGTAKIHDIDRVGANRWLVADIADDAAYVVNASTGVVSWRWNAQAAFPRAGGGSYPGDWTHINDVEVLADGSYMLSLRNQDQVVFVDPATGLNRSRTLGADGAHDILHEQHNPDLLRDGATTAVVVSDSENNRIVEYTRTGSTWTRSWTWRDHTLQWPRDADRLPDGNTLVTDTHGDRVLEVAPNGSVVWAVTVAGPYEAERLGTGPESTGGPPAVRADLTSRTADRADADASPVAVLVDAWTAAVWLLPPVLVNGVTFALPARFGVPTVGGLLVGGVTLVGWSVTELYWRRRALAQACIRHLERRT